MRLFRLLSHRSATPIKFWGRILFARQHIIPASLILAVTFASIEVQAQITTLYSENFGTGTAFPAGWSAANSSTWTISTSNSSTTPQFSGGSNAAAGSSSNSRTITYSNNLSSVGYNSITVLWAARKSINKTLTFEWSADGSNWNTLGITDVANNSTWAWINGGTGTRVALPAGAANAANLSFRWTFDTDGTGGAYRIDNFTVEGCQLPNAPGTITGSTSPCSGTSQVYSVVNVAGVTYTWTFPAGWTKTAGGTTNSVTVTTSGNSGNITVTPSNSCGNGTASTLAVTVSGIPSQPSAITGTITPCQGTSQTYSVTNVAGVTYSWTLPSGWTQTGGGSSNSITVNAGASSGNITVTPSNACGTGPSRQLAVTPVLSIPTSLGAISGNTSPCLGNTESYSVSAVSGINYTWVVPAGWTILSGQGTAAISVTVGAASGNITVTPSNSCGNGPSSDLAITVQTIPAQPGAITGNTSCCQGASLSFSVPNVAGVTFTWQFPADWTITSGQGTSAVTVTVGSIAGSIVVTPSNICGPGPSRSMAVSIINIPSQPSAISGNAIACKLSTQAYSVINVAGITYTWTVPVGWTINSGQGTNSILVTTSANSGNVTVTPSNACGNGTSQSLAVTIQISAPSLPSVITGNTVPCSGSTASYSVVNIPGTTYLWSVPAGWTISSGQGSNSITVTVGATPGNISVSPSNTCGGGASRTLAVSPLSAIPLQPSPISGNDTVCVASSQVYSVTNVANVTYTWSVPADWTLISGQGTNSIQVTVGTTSGTITVTPSNSCGNGSPSSITVVVESLIPPQSGPISGSQTPCEGSVQVYTIPAITGSTFHWTIPAGWILQSGQGTHTLTVLVGSNSGNIAVFASNSCGNGLSDTFPVTVDPLPVSAGVISGSNSLCRGEIQNFSVTAISGVTYTWSVPGGWVILSGQGTSSISASTGNTTGNVIVVPSNSCGNGPASSLMVNIKDTPQAFTGNNSTICEGASIQIGGPAVPGNTYSWTSDPPGYSSTESDPTVTPTTSTTYTLIEVNQVTGCSDTNSVTITLNQIITVTVNPSSLEQTICSGESTHIVLGSNITGTLFNWEAILTTGSGTTFNANGTGTQINELIMNTSGLVSQVTYNITATANVCTNTSTSVLINVNPAPVVPSQTATICSNSASGLLLDASTNAEPVASYNIFSINSNGLPAVAGNPVTGTGFSETVIADDAWSNTTLLPVDVLYTLEPVSASGCKGDVFTVKLTVHPRPILTNATAVEICSGATTNIPLTSNIPSSYSWTIGTITGGITGASAGTGDLISQVLNNPGNALDGTVEYLVVPTSGSGSCQGIPVSVIVTVHPKPSLLNAASYSVCSGSAFYLTLAASVTSTYTWSIGTISGGISGYSPGTGNEINQVLLNSSNSIAGSVQYIVVPTSQTNLCQGNPLTITVTVNPIPTVSASSSAASVCPGSLFNLNSSSSWAASPTIMSEDFNAATNTWARTNTSTGGTTANATWTLRPDGYVTNSQTLHSNDVSQFYLSDSRSQNGTVTATTLVSPLLSTVGYSDLSLSFWHYYDFNSTTGESAKVEVSTNNGTSWSTVATYTNDRGSPGSFQNVVLSLGATYINSSTFLVRFNYYCGSNRGRYWAIDNVVLTGTPTNLPAISWSSNPAGFTSTAEDPVGVTLTTTTQYLVSYTDPLTTCSGNASVTVNAYPVPEPEIVADYCSVPGMIVLTASGGGTYLWNTGETTQAIKVDIAGMYSVVVTNANGCTGAAYLSVSSELVVNGDFSAGNTGFTSGYAYDPTANGLVAPESEYAINSNANFNHSNFWGYDHTTGSGTGNANFLIVNGAKYAPQPFVWRETVTVLPNTDYYFSAWAISLNNVSPYAELRFSVNGTQVGTTAFLTAGQNILNNPWLLKDRFYGTWNSGASTTAIIEILDLNTSANGNDFGIDDISFGTLAPIPFSTDPTCSGDGIFCEGENVQLFANLTGGKPPVSYSWTGPGGFTSTLKDPVINGITTNGSGRYYLSVSDGYGCPPLTDSIDIIVYPLPSASITGPTSACLYSISPILTFTGTDGTAPYTFLYTINGGAQQSITTTFGSSVELSVPTNMPGTYIYTIVSISSDNGCSQTQNVSHTITINSLPTCIISGSSPVCPGTSGNQYSGQAAMSNYAWSISGNGAITGPFNAQVVSVTAGDLCDETFLLTLMTTDVNGCNAICQEEILVEDINPPALSCPASVTLPAEPGEEFANVSLSAPSAADNCSVADSLIFSWSLSAPSTGAGTGFIPSPYQFNVGTTTVSYTVTDLCGNSSYCSFTVTITPNDPPDITCPADILQNTQSGLCIASLDPGIPALNSGALPVSWQWQMSGATTGSGTGIPILPNPYTFNLGTTTIRWIASNISGSDTCYQTITVVDDQPPAFVLPGPFSFCVESINTAVYYDPTMDIQPDRPEYYTFIAGSTTFDLDISAITDNCSLGCTPEIRWHIDFADGSILPALPSLYFTGQPSTYSSDIQFPGILTGNLIHKISYQVVDCNGNASAIYEVNITITPRPNVIKQ
ncbi:MAG: HYR domain-containing protein [Bacteroidales bacterium]|nr:HYR domain-containing protein [Bacteroidales bacterium]